jgi:hypothetical protein
MEEMQAAAVVKVTTSSKNCVLIVGGNKHVWCGSGERVMEEMQAAAVVKVTTSSEDCVLIVGGNKHEWCGRGY